MYKFLPVICLAIFVAACSAPISQVAKDELAQPSQLCYGRRGYKNPGTAKRPAQQRWQKMA